MYDMPDRDQNHEVPRGPYPPILLSATTSIAFSVLHVDEPSRDHPLLG